MEPPATGDPVRVGDFVLHGRLCAGGMGEVFLGRSPGGRAVAVKVVQRRALTERLAAGGGEGEERDHPHRRTPRPQKTPMCDLVGPPMRHVEG
ncbi:hypothetical protein ACIRQP_41085 [Streptomyces sp. NPDC102274]|uniref:hypothetical protein n=1 Tax=Streptomyces sp. NPDC102274 TaxID=3366151 RepID=UPI00380871ED